MFGKFFASTFTGSLFGSGPDVFAVWGYVIANTVDATVELNPHLLSAVLGAPVERVDAAIVFLTQPDPQSRSQASQGRRLIHESAFQYHVVNHDRYRQLRNEEDRRAYNREAKRRERLKLTPEMSNGLSMTVNDISGESMTVIDKNRMSTMSAQAEAEAELEAEAKEREQKNQVQEQPQKSRRRFPQPVENWKLMLKIVHELIDEGVKPEDRKEELKTRCAQRKVKYTADSIRKALNSIEARRKK